MGDDMNTAEGTRALLSLPPELRNAIYGLVLAVRSDDYGAVKFGKRPKARNNARSSPVQALLQTCKQIYNEAIGFMYSVNTICLPNLRVKSFLDAMNQQRLCFITNLAVYDTGLNMGSFKFFEHLPRLSQLQKLIIILSATNYVDAMVAMEPEKLVQLQVRVARIPMLHEVRVTTALVRNRQREPTAWASKATLEHERCLELAFNVVIRCRAVARAIEEAWASGAVVLKKTGF